MGVNRIQASKSLVSIRTQIENIREYAEFAQNTIVRDSAVPSNLREEVANVFGQIVQTIDSEIETELKRIEYFLGFADKFDSEGDKISFEDSVYSIKEHLLEGIEAIRQFIHSLKKRAGATHDRTETVVYVFCTEKAAHIFECHNSILKELSVVERFQKDTNRQEALRNAIS